MFKPTPKLLIILGVCCIGLMMLLVACQPKQVTTEPIQPIQQPSTTTNTVVVAATPTADPLDQLVDYLVNLPTAAPSYSNEQVRNPQAKMNHPDSLAGSGVFPENHNTVDIFQTGSRGCLACHADLYGLVANLSPKLHPGAYPTYGKNDDIADCMMCHRPATVGFGPDLKNLIHSLHMNSDLFEKAYQGSCWNCHAITADGEFALWDEVKYDVDIAGYIPGATDAQFGWNTALGYEKGNLFGFDLVDEFGLEIEN